MKNSKILVVLIILLLVVDIILTFIGISKFNKVTNIEPNKVKENKQIVLYHNSINNEFCFEKEDEKVEGCNGNLEEIVIKTKDNIEGNYENYILDTYYDLFVLYKDDNKYMVYDNNSKESFEINTPKYGSDYHPKLFVYNNKVVGLIYGKKEGFYSINKDKMLFEGKNYEIEGYTDKFLAGNVEKCDKDDNCTLSYVNILGIEEEKVLKKLTPVKNAQSFYVKALTSKKGVYFIVYDYDYIYEIYNESLDLVYKANSSEEYLYYHGVSVGNDGKLYFAKDNIINVYNKSGKLVKESSEYDEIFKSIRGYNVVLKGNKLYLVKPDFSEIKLSSWNSKKNKFDILNTDGVLQNPNDDNIITIYIYDEDVTVDGIWEDCQKYGCEYKTKDDIDIYKKGYKFIYNIKTDELQKIRTDQIAVS